VDRKLIYSLIVVLSLFNTAYSQVREGQKLDAVVAVVGKYPIFRSSIDGQIALYQLQRNVTQLPSGELEQLREQFLQSEIDQKVLLVRAEQDSLTVTEEEIDERINEQIKVYERQAGSLEVLEKQLGKSVQELKSSPDFRDRAREAILIEKLRYSKFTGAQDISRHDVETFYNLYRDSLPSIGDQVELASIIKYIKPQADQEKRVKDFAKKLIDSLRNGADFTTFAARYSQHSTASSGGDLGGPYPRGTFVPEFEAAAFKLKPGEISDVVQTEQGYHIIKLLDRKGEEIRLAQILLKAGTSKTEEDSIYRVMQQLRSRIMAGEDFAKVAQAESDDAETRSTGGSLGRVRLEELAPGQKNVVDSLEVGAVSEPVKIALSKTLTGYQIIKLISKVSSHSPTLSTDYREIEYAAKQWKFAADFQKFIAESRNSVYVDKKDLKSVY
jgi:peptidyl-prolyl cis-trans isomerase SurA